MFTGRMLVELLHHALAVLPDFFEVDDHAIAFLELERTFCTALIAIGAYDIAEEILVKRCKLLRASGKETESLLYQVATKLASAYVKQAKFPDAIKTLKAVIRLQRRCNQKIDVMVTRVDLSLVLLRDQQTDEAKALASKTRAMLQGAIAAGETSLDITLALRKQLRILELISEEQRAGGTGLDATATDHVNGLLTKVKDQTGDRARRKATANKKKKQRQRKAKAAQKLADERADKVEAEKRFAAEQQAAETEERLQQQEAAAVAKAAAEEAARLLLAEAVAAAEKAKRVCGVKEEVSQAAAAAAEDERQHVKTEAAANAALLAAAAEGEDEEEDEQARLPSAAEIASLQATATEATPSHVPTLEETVRAHNIELEVASASNKRQFKKLLNKLQEPDPEPDLSQEECTRLASATYAFEAATSHLTDGGVAIVKNGASQESAIHADHGDHDEQEVKALDGIVQDGSSGPGEDTKHAAPWEGPDDVDSQCYQQQQHYYQQWPAQNGGQMERQWSPEEVYRWNYWCAYQQHAWRQHCGMIAWQQQQQQQQHVPAVPPTSAPMTPPASPRQDDGSSEDEEWEVGYLKSSPFVAEEPVACPSAADWPLPKSLATVQDHMNLQMM